VRAAAVVVVVVVVVVLQWLFVLFFVNAALQGCVIFLEVAEKVQRNFF
jgi:hypothetical protein